MPHPLILLRIAPLLSSTAAVSMTLCEDVFLRPFGAPHPTLRKPANRLLLAHVNAFKPYAMAMTATFYFSAIGTAVVNIKFRDGGLGLSGTSTAAPRNLSAVFYLAGVVFNALHFAFAPRDLALLDIVADEDRVDADKGKDNCTAMASWVSLNVSRGLLADFPGFVCTFAGFLLSLS
ncbi:hypothetical protein F4820DRAFT_421104 [Hypoxylon rubiginosum]|uniref:Uncharacterized protein n=1 Tax=Hypoxylon rubiginosum TaxID=110542 RepID=A0ACB9Z1K9_9PEZI|nr:hypothetical protein F4820DRAFT_421104 [Hypoxylon rubiginosum]